MTSPDTIRARLEAIRDRNFDTDDYVDAAAAVDLLDQTERCGCVGWLLHLANTDFRFVADPVRVAGEQEPTT